MKNKKEKIKTVKAVSYGLFSYYACPHCGKPIICSDEPTIKALKKWRKLTNPNTGDK